MFELPITSKLTVSVTIEKGPLSLITKSGVPDHAKTDFEALTTECAVLSGIDIT